MYYPILPRYVRTEGARGTPGKSRAKLLIHRLSFRNLFGRTSYVPCGSYPILRVHRKMLTISCDMFHAPLNSVYPYISISYVWGDPRVTKLIKGGGVELAASM